MWPEEGIIPNNASAVVVFPQPDSPANPRTCPSFNSNEIPSTAFTGPFPVLYWTLRSFTSRSDDDNDNDNNNKQREH